MTFAIATGISLVSPLLGLVLWLAASQHDNMYAVSACARVCGVCVCVHARACVWCVHARVCACVRTRVCTCMRARVHMSATVTPPELASRGLLRYVPVIFVCRVYACDCAASILLWVSSTSISHYDLGNLI